MAGRRETDDLKPIDKAIPGMVSEPPGRNESERTGSLEREQSWRPRSSIRIEGSMVRRRLADAVSHSSGVLATARWQGRVEQLEKPSSSH
jgi:hypothetical protein